VEALEHGRNDLVDLADDFLARLHFECVYGFLKCVIFRYGKQKEKRSRRRSLCNAVDNLESS
jgi:hypothetical protein